MPGLLNYNCYLFYLLPFIGLRLISSRAAEDPLPDPGTLKSRLNFKSVPLSRELPSRNFDSKTREEKPEQRLPDFLQNIYSKAAKEGKLTTPYENVNEIKLYPDKSGAGNKYTFLFSIPERESTETTVALELRLFTKLQFWTKGSHQIHIYQIIPTVESTNTPQTKNTKFSYLSIYLTSVYLNYSQPDQQVVRIKHTLLHNYESTQRHKIRLVLSPNELPVGVIENPNKFTDKQFHESIFRNNDSPAWSHRPLIVYYVTDKLNVVDTTQSWYPTVFPLVNQHEAAHEEESEMRMRRSLPGYTQNPCRLVQFIANFTEIGWTKDFVIGPETFEMNLCMGECPWPSDQRYNATNHAIMQGTFSAYNTHVGRTKVPQPCCVPDKLMPLPLLYMEPSQNVILKTFRDMVAAHCGCY